MKINSTALIRATTGTIWAIVAMTLASELSPSFKNFLVSTAGHHWIAKSVFSVLIFILIYLSFIKSKEPRNVLKSVAVVFASVILGGLVIFSFFVWQYFK